nr:hypothetical protein [uncultured Blautia sp.]
MGTKIKLFVSENLKEKIKTSSKLFNVTQKDWILFLLLNRYDLIYDDICKQNYEKVKNDLEVSYTSEMRNYKFLPTLQFEMSELVYNIFRDLADKLNYKTSKLLTLMLYQNQILLEDIPSYYKKKQKDMGKLVRALTGSKEKVTAENQIYVVLKKLGMSQKSFSSIASAYVFYYMFSSMNEDLWMEVLNGRGLTREN